MNRLKKNGQSPQKSTISTGTTPGPSLSTGNAVVVRPPLQANRPVPSETYKTALQPRSGAEQYWAARALSAETLLAARVEHHRELRSLSFVEEAKRAKERAMHDARHAKLEKLVLALLAMLFVLMLALLNFVRTSASVPHTRKPPAHFTIPIFSPFTSVVEHETSVIGSKTLTVFAFALAGLAYFAFRHWLARRK
ncbi:hypothetical protein B0H16DRAFT_1662539 [Mycena metata]|uniref:Uncharacterized protein n=1 Tax=Mycena metata TaxID=1033252 RepID=A0AAD7NEE1_9AGAR|nr:hypothetical protein B0H16DRAFT_1662539 [Mycena metata]